MQIAQVLSGYTLGGADLLRRAMGKKKPEEMAKQRESFVRGACAKWKDMTPAKAGHIFDLIEKFAGYGFNRSHSAAYALLAYQTAWLKAHYPAAFMSAVLSADMDHTDKVVTMIAECRDMKLKILPPDVNRCGYEFVPLGDDTILYGLGAIKGLGAAAIEAIMEARTHGPFEDLFDFCRRIDMRRANRRVLECLIRSGAMDALGPDRAVLMASLDKAIQLAEQHAQARDAGQSDLFGAIAQEPTAESRYVEAPAWSEQERLDAERETLGLYLTGHPIRRYKEELAQITDATLADLRPNDDQTMIVAGLVVAMRTLNTRRGDRMAFITLDDQTGRLELAVFSELFQRHRDILVKDNLLVVEGNVATDDFTGGFKMSAERIYNVDQARAAFAKRLVIEVDPTRAANGFIGELKQILAPVRRGTCPIFIRYERPDAEAEILLGDEWRVTPTGLVLEQLERLVGERRVRLVYADR